MKLSWLIFLLCGLSIMSFSQTGYREEFNGPFPSWANVKTRFKAAGDGIKDDTRALQMALDSLTTSERVIFNDKAPTNYAVVYLPAGTYRITQTLRLTGKIGVAFIGEDPEKTIIKWEGGDSDTMLFCNRAAYMKISRITWDANNKANIEILGLHYKDFAEPNYAPTSVEFSDMIFKGKPRYGISAGTYASEGTGMMDAEVVIRRCKFISCLGAGISIKGFNALDYWIWDSEFTDCNTGIDCTHGNYHVYKSHFKNSVTADIATSDAIYSSVRGCYSNNSKAFSVDAGASCNAFKRIFQDNFVKGAKSVPIQYHHQGKISLMDNYFLNDSIVPYSIDYTSWCKGNYDILSIENNYAETTPQNLRKDLPSMVHSIADKKINRKAMKLPAIQPLQPFVRTVKRKTFEVPVGAGSLIIQRLINKASALKGERAIIHFPMGIYNIDTSLNIPAGSDIQLVGDGMLYASVLKTTRSKDAAFNFFQINGPSYITIRDLQIGQDGARDKTNAFVFTNIDQRSSQVKIDQIYSKAINSIYIDKLNYTYFEKNNSFFSKGHVIIGGDKVKAGTGTSKLHCFGGQSAGVHLEDNATMVAKDCWWEGSAKKDFIPQDLSGNGNFTVDGAFYAPSDQDSGVIIKISAFSGKVTFMNMVLLGSIDVKPNSPNLKMLAWNINNYYKKNPFYSIQQKMASQVAMIGFTTQCFNTATAKCATEDPQSLEDKMVNVPNLNRFINELTNDSRKAKPKPYTNLATGISNIYISRVSVENGSTACLFNR